MPSARMPNGNSAASRNDERARTKFPETIEQLHGTGADAMCSKICKFIVSQDTERETAAKLALDAVETFRAHIPKIISDVERADESARSAHEESSRARRDEHNARAQAKHLSSRLDGITKLNVWREKEEDLARKISAMDPVEKLESDFEKLNKDLASVEERTKREKLRVNNISAARDLFLNALDKLHDVVNATQLDSDENDSSHKRDREPPTEQPGKRLKLGPTVEPLDESREDGEVPETT